MKLIFEKNEFENILSNLKIEKTISGGSVANSIVGLSQLGNEVGFIGKISDDELGNKYYESKSGKRWVIYADTIDASNIPVEWYSWIHFTPNKIEKKHNFEKYDWQKSHQSNLTGTEKAYHPNKNKDVIKKKYSSWKE